MTGSPTVSTALPPADLSVDLGRGLLLPNPVGLASGTAGYGFELRTIYSSGWAVVAASLVLTLAAWITDLFMQG